MAKKHDPKTGRFVRTTPDYKALYEDLKTLHKETDEENNRLRACYTQAKDEAKHFHEQFVNELDRGCRQDEKISFLLDHCGPICKWLYRKHFGKEGGE